MVTDIEVIQRYCNARYMLTEAFNQPGTGLAQKVVDEFVSVSDEMHERGIIYHELGSIRAHS
jgi:hypothetical protein